MLRQLHFPIGEVSVNHYQSGHRNAQTTGMYGQSLTIRRQCSSGEMRINRFMDAVTVKDICLTVLTIIVLFFVPAAAFAETNVVDLTPLFIAGGIDVDRLLVYQVGDIVLIRGRTGDSALAAEASRFAQKQGYRRVANLIEIVPAIGDAGIERVARRRLEMSRELAGCTFQVDSSAGMVRLGGRVTNELQKGYALRLVSRLDGVKGVHSALTMPPL